MSKVRITETILRDAHQSQAATRMKLSEMLPAAKQLNDAGFWALECWGGATFDSCMRYLDEDPWIRLRKLREAMPDAKLQMLLRGQNLLGYKHYADDVVEEFVKKTIENGIDIIRVFDALNDPWNLKTALNATKKYGGHLQVAMSYTTSPVHTRDYFVKLAKELEDMGADSICVKDMAGLLLPYEAYELVKAIKAVVKVPVEMHTHDTAGVGAMTLLKSVEAGVDIVDTALSPLGSGTAQPATEPFVKTLEGTPYDTGLDLGKLNELAKHFKTVADRLKDEGFLDPMVLGVDVNALVYQVPGGMLSNLISQLKKANALNRLPEVLAEVPRVREDFGFPPLVTPTSQIVGTQAVLNVLTGQRYKMLPNESKGILRGEYGRLPASVNPDVQKLALTDGSKVITCRPADLIGPEMDSYREKVKSLNLYQKEEDVLSYALFPQVAETFFAARRYARYRIERVD